MITLAEFLREQGEKAKIEAVANAETIKEWRAAVEQLFEQMTGWLRASDPEGILSIERVQIEIREPGLGRYMMPKLSLQGLDNWIGIIPKARNTVGTVRLTQNSALVQATGRVDITNEIRKFVLLRVPVEGNDIWIIDDGHTEQKPLDQNLFDEALLSYLR